MSEKSRIEKLSFSAAYCASYFYGAFGLMIAIYFKPVAPFGQGSDGRLTLEQTVNIQYDDYQHLANFRRGIE